LHGAHVTAWQPSGQAPVIWMGSRSWFEAGKAIRGGIPICWPWFGPAAEAGQPAHGLVRQTAWSLEALRVEADGTAVAELGLELAEPAARLRAVMRFGARLEVELAATNLGAAPIEVGEALHTYLAVSDVRRIAVRGLAGVWGEDRVAAPVPVVGPERLGFEKETDLLFQGHEGEIVVEDPGWGRRLRVGKRGSRSTVVWNPWTAKAARMPDYGDHEWPGMVCVEAANAGGDVYRLQPTEAHILGTTVEIG
jgi:glucose-6-phosphate 1-epimerase